MIIVVHYIGGTNTIIDNVNADAVEKIFKWYNDRNDTEAFTFLGDGVKTFVRKDNITCIDIKARCEK